jgi:hypothetical protein
MQLLSLFLMISRSQCFIFVQLIWRVNRQKTCNLILFIMGKRLLTISFMLIMCALGTSAQTQNTSWNYTTLDNKGLEERMVRNIRNGNPAYQDVFLALTFTVEDFGKLKKSFDDLGNELNAATPITEIVFDGNQSVLTVVFPRETSDTDGFLSTCKDIMAKYEVYLVGYEEQYLLSTTTK